MSNSPPPEQDLTEYSFWAEKMWVGNPQGFKYSEESISVMSLGLGGEAGEVLEVLKGFPVEPVNTDRALKELGDVFYYFISLCNGFNLNPARVFQDGSPVEFLSFSQVDEIVSQLPALPEKDILQWAVELSIRASAVQECLKKRLRDGCFNQDIFSERLGLTGIAWLGLVSALDLKPSAVIKKNMDKVSDRFNRGMLQGSGDNR